VRGAVLVGDEDLALPDVPGQTDLVAVTAGADLGKGEPLLEPAEVPPGLVGGWPSAWTTRGIVPFRQA
jgi:hypothetical protein